VVRLPAAGKVGILLEESFFAPLIVNADPPVTFTWDVAKYPAGPKADVMLGNAGLWVMSKASQNKQAAWEAIKHWTIPSMDYFEGVGTTPILSTWKEDGWWADNEIMAKLQGLVQYAHQPLLHAQLLQFKTIAEPFIDQVYPGQMTPGDALQQISDQIATALATG
jgi:ABC-type glycerol-3-phosphate transport system substrate-binding protein